MKINLDYINKNVSNKQIMFALCMEGSIKVGTPTNSFIINKNNLLLMSGNYTTVEEMESSKVIYFVFGESILKKVSSEQLISLFRNIAENPYVELSHDQIESLLGLYDILQQRLNSSVHNKGVIEGLQQTIMAEISSIYEQGQIKQPGSIAKGNSIIDRFFTLLLKYHQQERSVAFYADKLCLTPKYLSSVVKKTTGRSVCDWVNEAVILNAKMMLSSSDMTAQQLSDYLNFPNPSFFGRFFKQHTGKTTREYRTGIA